MQLNLHDFATACRALLPIIPKHPDVRRYYQRGLHLYTRGYGSLVMEVTDGHRAARVVLDVDANDESFDVIVDREAVEKIAKNKVRKSDAGTTTVSWKVDAAGNITMDGVVISQIVNCRFPESLALMFDAPAPWLADIGNELVLGMHAGYLADVFKSAAMLAHPKYAGVRITAQGEMRPLRVEVATNHGGFTTMTQPAYFLVMPLRT